MARLTFAFVSVLLTSSLAASSVEDIRPLDSRPQEVSNPIRLEGQIREVTIAHDHVVIRLHRDRYPIIATRATRVRWLDGRRARAAHLRVGDSIRVEGNLEQKEIVAERITILLRIEHRP